eukprot:8617818-Karenia_brevis.AAC.1
MPAALAKVHHAVALATLIQPAVFDFATLMPVALARENCSMPAPIAKENRPAVAFANHLMPVALAKMHHAVALATLIQPAVAPA